jgi:hypothetical protein
MKMSESGDYTPAPHWKGHDFADAHRAYGDKVVKGSMVAATSAGVKAGDLVPDTLSCDAESPLVICCDVTGSMGEWPKTIFSKLPYLEHEGKEYLGDDMEISFAAVGDGPYGDRYPLQVRKFVQGAALKEELESLVVEKGGGANKEESYDLAAAYYSRNCDMKKAIRKPIFIFIGDEGIYSTMEAGDAKNMAKVNFQGRTSAEKIFEALKKKFNVYVIRKPYNCTDNNRSPEEIAIQNQWAAMLGDDHVVSLPSAERVVDVIFGILARETGRIDYFEKELKDRQLKDSGGKVKVDVVLKSLRSIHSPAKSMKALAPPPDRAKSVTRRKAKKGTDISLKKDDDGISLRDDD